MQIRKRYYIINADNYKNFDLAVKWTKKPKLERIIIKAANNLRLGFVRRVLQLFGFGHICPRTYYDPFISHRTFPVSLTTDEIKKALQKEYKANTNLSFLLSKDLKIKGAELEKLKQESLKTEREHNKYYLELMESL